MWTATDSHRDCKYEGIVPEISSFDPLTTHTQLKVKNREMRINDP